PVIHGLESIPLSGPCSPAVANAPGPHARDERVPRLTATHCGHLEDVVAPGRRRPSETSFAGPLLRLRTSERSVGLDPPNWSHKVERPLSPEEGRGLAQEDPDARIGDGGDQQRRKLAELGRDVVAGDG